jgi:predicted DNA-binding protein (MmcQ/YjbR family)
MSTADDIGKLALALPGVEQKPHFGSRSYRAGGKIFIQTGANKNEAIFKLSPVHQEILFEARPEAFRPEIWGAIRWARLLLDHIAADELPELVREAYEQVTIGKKKPVKKKAKAAKLTKLRR